MNYEISPKIIEKSKNVADKSELTKILGFIDLIEISLNIIFYSYKDIKKDFNIWESQKLELKFDSKNFSTDYTILETMSNTTVNTLGKKIPIITALEKLQNSKATYLYIPNDNPKNSKLNIIFNFKKKASNYYPVEINLLFQNIDKNPDDSLAIDIIYNILNQIRLNNNLPTSLISKTTNKFKQSGHYIDLKLKHNFKSESEDLTQSLANPRIRNLVNNEIDQVLVSGIKIDPSEDKILNAILKLLHLKSDRNENSDHYYKGNMPPQQTMYGGRVTDYPVLRFLPSELYKEYTESQTYSGAEVQYIKQTLIALQDKKYLIVYKRHRADERGNKVIDRIEEYQPLLKIITYYEGITREEDLKLDRGQSITDDKGEIIIVLNPIFIDQIDTKFIEYPKDINQRTSIASGGSRKVTESNIRIRDYLLRELSSRHYTVEINEDKLPYILGLDNYIEKKRRKLINIRIQQAVEFAINFGILSKVQLAIGTEGQKKYIFELNKTFYIQNT